MIGQSETTTIIADHHEERGLSLLTVGDGDLSCSLAIQRAHAKRHHLVATTLLSSEGALLQTYASAKEILEELESEIFYGVDATQLHRHPDLLQRRFDLVLFHHPHLGYSDDVTKDKEVNTVPNDTSTAHLDHATRHASLLAHYFHSAQQLISPGGAIHVCLTSGAVHSWKLDEIVQGMNLQYAWDSPRAASRPLLERVVIEEAKLLTNDDDNDENKNVDGVQQKQSAGRHHRSGSRRGHWLGRYGYRHRPTFPEKTEFQTNVSSSYHYFLRPNAKKPDDSYFQENEYGASPLDCPVCWLTFGNEDDLQAHLLAPALPME